MTNNKGKNKSYYKYWGKADSINGESESYHLLVYHCLDVASIGYQLLTENPRLLEKISSIVRIPEKDLKDWIVYFLSIHDIGKFAEAFQNLKPQLKQRLQGKSGKRKYLVRHDTLGYLAWDELWKRFRKEGIFGFAPGERGLGTAMEVMDVWLKSVTGHHGIPPHPSKDNRRFRARNFFELEDLDSAFDFIITAGDLFIKKPEHLQDFLENRELENLFTEASWWIAGIAVVCDWIGSDSSMFSYCSTEIPLDEYWEKKALPTAKKALLKSGILPSCPAEWAGIGKLFDYVEIPTPLQKFCDEYPPAGSPQLWILEDVTGAGKTEAAMTIVHKLMSRGLAGGVYVGLPTMATANAMYDRMAKTYMQLYGETEKPSLVLAHSARHLMKEFLDSIIDPESNSSRYYKDEQTASSQCAAWLADNRKKALLADMGIGTIDQALSGILPGRHQSMRLLGLADKVLLVDEVHAYDTYMHHLLMTLLEFHAAMGGSAVLLSATLPKEMREELVDAYLKGRGEVDEERQLSDAYPLVTVVSNNKMKDFHVETRKEVERSVTVEMLTDEKTLYNLIVEKALNGGCVCWIRNTVSDARTAFSNLKKDKRLNPENVHLFHSRFALYDRLNKEKEVLDLFGKKSSSEQRSGKILLATQVVEQSLDLDFDFMASDLAPIDLLIQRAGRLHRHIRNIKGNRITEDGQKDERPKPVFHVYSPEPIDVPGPDWYSEMFPLTGKVYPHTGQLWRTARLLKQKGKLEMPGGARELIEGVYSEEGEPFPEALDQASWEAEGEQYADGDMARFNALALQVGYNADSGRWTEDERIPTRLGADTHDVYLTRYEDGTLSPWVSGKYPWDLSRAKISVARLTELSTDLPEGLKSALDKLKLQEKELNEFSFVLPLSCTDDGHWIAEGVDGKGNQVEVVYDQDLGLLLGDEVKQSGIK